MKTHKKLTSLFLLITLSVMALMLSACSKPALDVLPADAVIIAFGDSLTVGVGATPNESYPSTLANLTGLTAINSGVSGEKTNEGLKRLPSALNETQPDLVILIEGGNDILQQRPHDSIKKNLSEMIKLIHNRNIPLIMLGIPEKKISFKLSLLLRRVSAGT